LICRLSRFGYYADDRSFRVAQPWRNTLQPKEGALDFIERIFGVSPDGGDGSLEFLYVAGIVVAVAFVVRVLYHRRTRERSIYKG
jgi:hypothetical protein